MFSNKLMQIVFVASIILICVTIFFIGKTIRELAKSQRHFKANSVRGFVSLTLSFFVTALILFCLYEIPGILYNGYNWSMLWEIGPDSLLWGAVTLAVLTALMLIMYLLTYYFPKTDDSPYFMIAVMSVLSGFGNSVMVFVTNEALTRNMRDQNRAGSLETGLYVYFILGLVLFTASDYYARRKLIALTNKTIYKKRMAIVDKIFNAPYYKFESMDQGKTFAALNNDPENVSAFVNMFVQIITGTVSLLVCFVYLGTLNGYGALLSIGIVIAASVLFMLMSRSAQKLYEKNRDVQNTFFKNIGDMISGFKELYINKRKCDEFHKDIGGSCKAYTDTRIAGDYKFVGVSIFGNTMYMLVIGVVVFTFPMLFRYIQGNTLSSFVVVYLYMGGIVTMLTSMVPNLVRVIVSFKRINSFIREVSEPEEEKCEETDDTKGFSLNLENVEFHYKNENGGEFSLGPISYTFNAGEIVFICGGNGSGKTTLSKLITGLYQPDSGEITVNGIKVDSKTLGSYFTTVYSDFYLFDKIYGVDIDEKRQLIDHYLEVLKIKNKVSVEGDRFSTTRLSTGQRKRLALLISYLEDKPVYFFDEWAADQDPEFRKIFYTELLPELKMRGKAVIAITHDDRYFDLADRVIKMELGKIVDREYAVI